MKAKILSDSAIVYSAMDLNSPQVVKLKAGTSVEIVTVDHEKYIEWVEIKLDDGRKGYVSGDVEVLLEQQTSDRSKIALWGSYAGGAIFLVLNLVTQGGVSGHGGVWGDYKSITLGCILGAAVGYALAWLIAPFIPTKKK